MKDFTMAEFGVFLGVIGGVLTSLILTLQKSKCETIRCCGCEVKRKVQLKKEESMIIPTPSP